MAEFPTLTMIRRRSSHAPSPVFPSSHDHGTTFDMSHETIGRGVFHHGDCLDIMPAIPDGSVDMILADLPYAVTKSSWDQIIPFEPLWENYWRVLKPTGVIALTASQPFTSLVVTSQIRHFKHEWIWIKNRGSNFANTVREPFKEHETVLIFSKGKWIYNKQMQDRTGSGGDRVKYDFDYSSKTDNYGEFIGRNDQKLGDLRVPSSWQKFNTEVGLHPTQKPVSLFAYIIRTYTDPGQTVLDNCAGSGTTAIACEDEGRNWICIERDRGYYDKATKRVRDRLGTVKDDVFEFA